MEASGDSLLVLYKVFFSGGGGGEVTGFEIVTTIMAKSRGTLNSITRQIPKFFEIYTQSTVNGL